MSAKQYKNDFFRKLAVSFKKNKTILDLGCGDGADSKYFIKRYKLKYIGMDVYQHPLINKQKLLFKIGNIFKIPFDKKFDYIFMRDVLHHIDETKQRKSKHIQALKNVRDICKKNGVIIIAEGNRYNPLFYPHMVKMLGHDHFKQSYFKEIITQVFKEDDIKFRFFEAHVYPDSLIWLFRIYETVLEKTPFLQKFIAYNCVILTKN